jgi:hypothetical protein
MARTMFVCPHDMHWCDLAACRSDGCRLSGERPLIACYGCGALVVRATRFGFCVECITVEIEQTKERA